MTIISTFGSPINKPVQSLSSPPIIFRSYRLDFSEYYNSMYLGVL